MNILIIGVGTVGSNLSRELAVLDPDLYDKYKTSIPGRAAFVMTPLSSALIRPARTATSPKYAPRSWNMKPTCS